MANILMSGAEITQNSVARAMSTLGRIVYHGELPYTATIMDLSALVN
eukprot:CAMPEP_0167796154 /NCGR_PEP_ID=MMETSP0111_2-20121227/14882_1 /TAXON_ID=91324 /ORGANISM="Lotharella globosa, Strain CCCM811" /LENGTH=46 /DNA_ID= /DNA_START= /DNA_END= /DNA_ORIENTATION=